MNWNGLKPPTLCPVSQCHELLNFKPHAFWPSQLPAVAIQGYVIAGFGQKLAFNHEIDLHRSEAIADLFHSLYPKISQEELNRLWLMTQHLRWFPIIQIANRYGLTLDLIWDHAPDLGLAKIPCFH